MFKLLLNRKPFLQEDSIDSLKNLLKEIAISLSNKGIQLMEQSDTHIAYMDDDEVLMYEIA